MRAGIGCGERSIDKNSVWCWPRAKQTERRAAHIGGGPCACSVLADDEVRNAATRHRSWRAMLVNVYALSTLSACFDHEFLNIARMGYRIVKA